MIFDLLLIAVGFALLLAGGELLVRGASGIALIARISPAVVGLTVVAAGTSMPELVVSIQAALAGSPGLAVGNVVGSNIFNIGAILGLTALLHPLRIDGNSVRFEWPVMMLATLLFYLLIQDGDVNRLEGGVLFAGLIAFIVYAVWVARKAVAPLEQEEFSQVTTASFGRIGRTAIFTNVVAVVVGAGLLALGSTALVRGATGVASLLGVSKTVIGLTIVAAGTSTPELFTSLVAARRGQADVAVANVIGSNIFNLLGILGATALLHPLAVPPEITTHYVWWLLGASLLMLPLMKTGMRISRTEGGLLFTGFLAYLLLLVVSS